MRTSLSEQGAPVSPGSSTTPQVVSMSIQGAPARDLSAEDAYSQCAAALNSLLPPQQLSVLSQLFVDYIHLHACSRVPEDFLNVTVEGIRHLSRNGRSNVIYLLAKALGTMRSDGLDSLLPTKRMPMGLIEHIVNFFTVDAINKVCLHSLHAFMM